MSKRYTLGIDLSSTKTGYAVWDSLEKRIINSGVYIAPKWKSENFITIYGELINEISSIITDIIEVRLCREELLIAVELSDVISASTTNRFFRMYGWLEALAFSNGIEIKPITPNEWRRFYFDEKFHNWRQVLPREQMKKLAIRIAKQLTGIVCETDDEAEAILISIVGHKAETLDNIKETNVKIRKAYKNLRKYKENARDIIWKLEIKSKTIPLTKSELAKLEKYKATRDTTKATVEKEVRYGKQ